MARSLKKGPFVDSHLADRIEEMNRKNEKKIFKTWSPYRFTMGKGSSRFL
jgi:small subunit ribosomal protein S19